MPSDDFISDVLHRLPLSDIMRFKQFTEKSDINTNSITYTGLMCQSKVRGDF